MVTRLIVNADDFGLCRGVNAAICDAHTKGILTSATIMANMGGAEEAVKIAKDLPDLGVGVHLNFLEGPAVSNDPKVAVLLDNDGEFAYSPGKLAKLSLLKKSFRKAIEIESAAQIKWVIDKGITPTHADSHKHVHSFPTIYPSVLRAVKGFGIKAVRWPCEPSFIWRNCWPKVSKNDRIRARIVSTMARINRLQDSALVKNDGFIGLAHTGAIDEKFWLKVCRCNFDGVAEIMTHPGYTEGLDPAKTRLIEERKVELKSLCSDAVIKAVADAKIELIHYGNL